MLCHIGKSPFFDRIRCFTFIIRENALFFKQNNNISENFLRRFVVFAVFSLFFLTKPQNLHIINIDFNARKERLIK